MRVRIRLSTFERAYYSNKTLRYIFRKLEQADELELIHDCDSQIAREVLSIVLETLGLFNRRIKVLNMSVVHSENCS